MSELLYRSEVVQARQVKWAGDIIAAPPVTIWWLTSVGLAIAFALIIFAFFASYTARSTVSGELTPAEGLIKVYPPETAVVLEKRVSEGQQVKKGDVLYLLSSERTSSAVGGIQEAAIQQIEIRKRSLQSQELVLKKLSEIDRDALAGEIRALELEATGLSQRIDEQISQVDSSTRTESRYQELSSKGYVSVDQYVDRQSAAREQRGRLSSLQRDLLAVRRQLETKRSEKATVPLKYESEIAELRRGIALADQEIAQSEIKRSLSIVAPQAGRVSTLLAEVGQVSDPSKPIASVVPQNSVLTAHLYAPSRAIGFLKSGNRVNLRYEAYPYQKFGYQKGTVVNITAVGLSLNEIRGLTMNSQQLAGETFYKVVVALDSQSIIAYGSEQKLQAGMTVEADILRETRRIYEWALEPLFSISGKLR